MATETVAVVVFKRNNVLLVRHTEGAKLPTDSYGLPAGRRRPKEASIDAGRREFNQETGLMVNSEDLEKLPTEYSALMMRSGKEVLMTMKVYFGKKYKGSLKNSSETFPEWIAIENLEQLNLLPNVHNAIKEAYALKSKPS
ncbi:MAG: NUDIX hydrolase [Patescibacteria group bacterium]